MHKMRRETSERIFSIATQKKSAEQKKRGKPLVKQKCKYNVYDGGDGSVLKKCRVRCIGLGFGKVMCTRNTTAHPF